MRSVVFYISLMSEAVEVSNVSTFKAFLPLRYQHKRQATYNPFLIFRVDYDKGSSMDCDEAFWSSCLSSIEITSTNTV